MKCNVGGARPTILTVCFKDTDACFVKCALDFFDCLHILAQA